MTGIRSTPHLDRAEWTFLTNHAHVLICVHEDPSIRTRDIAVRVGITERAVQRLISDLCEAGYVTRTREGRRNHYEVHSEKPLRHPVEAPCLLSGLLETVNQP
ncbi:MAG: winged helix-turn-helix domain-containing protein [Gemmatimonadota bacterium]